MCSIFEVDSEISSGQIERAVEADENGVINSESEDELSVPQEPDQRMLKSDSDIGSFFTSSCIGEQLDVTKGSTDTLVYNERDLGNCSDHNPCSDRKPCNLEESIVEHLMRKKIQGRKDCSEDRHLFCPI